MAALKKYMFDLDFDAVPPPMADAPVDQMADSDALPLDEQDALPPAMYSEFEVDEAKRIAYAEGQAAGVAEANAALERAHADALAALAKGIAATQAAQRDGIEALRRDAVQLAGSRVTKKIHPEMARLHGVEEIAGVMRECLLQIDEAARLTVRAHPDLLDGVRDEAVRVTEAAEFEGKIVFTADPKLAPGDCRVEWGNGGADRDQALLWAEIDAIVTRAIDGDARSADTRPRPPPSPRRLVRPWLI